MIEANGHNGQIVFDGDHVTITRKGLLGRMSVGKGDKRWHISQISSIQWKPAGPLVNGFIQLSASGGNERRSKFGSQTTSAAGDENSVLFTKKQQADFETLRAALDTAIAQQHAGPAVAASSVADEITKLAGLREQGLIDDEEFEAQKRRLLEG
jgi:hypothetical protein